MVGFYQKAFLFVLAAVLAGKFLMHLIKARNSKKNLRLPFVVFLTFY